LKYDGVNLQTLYNVFKKTDKSELSSYVNSKPIGKYAKKIWYLYEFLTGDRLDVPDASKGNYVDLLDGEDYCSTPLARPSRRHRVNDNMLGGRSFCPTVRRSAF